MSEAERGDGVVDELLVRALDAAIRPVRGRFDSEIRSRGNAGPKPGVAGDAVAPSRPRRFGCPLRNDVPDLVVLMDPDLVQPVRAGIQGTPYDLLLPESLRLSYLPFPVHEDALTVSPTVVEDFDKCLHARNHRFICHDLHQVVCSGRQPEAVQCVAQPIPKVTDVGHEHGDCRVFLALQKLLRCHGGLPPSLP